MSIIDRELVHAALDNPGAFAELYNRHYAAVHRTILAKIRDYHDAEDIAQSVFVEAYHTLTTLKDPERLGAWLHRIAVRRAVDWIRKQIRTRHTVDDYTDTLREAGPGKHRAQKIADRAARALARLAPDQRQLLSDFYVSGYSLSELARRNRVPVGTVKSRLHSARRQARFLAA